jgi:hypothetical protein
MRGISSGSLQPKRNGPSRESRDQKVQHDGALITAPSATLR